MYVGTAADRESAWAAAETLGAQYSQFKQSAPMGSSVPTEVFALAGLVGGNLDTDSNNDGAIDDSDNLIEADPATPGTITFVNDDDTDEDGIPDFADGFNRDGLANTGDELTAGEHFVPVKITLPA